MNTETVQKYALRHHYCAYLHSYVTMTIACSCLKFVRHHNQHPASKPITQPPNLSRVGNKYRSRNSGRVLWPGR